MQRIPVDSSNLKSIGYDNTVYKLEIEFKSGHVYQYSGVPEKVYDGLMGAESHGVFFSRNIRDVYAYIRIS